MEDVVVSNTLPREQREFLRVTLQGGQIIACSLYDAKRNHLIAKGTLRDVSEGGLGVFLAEEIKELKKGRELLAEFQCGEHGYRLHCLARHQAREDGRPIVGIAFLPESHENVATYRRLARFVRGLLAPWTLRA